MVGVIILTLFIGQVFLHGKKILRSSSSQQVTAVCSGLLAGLMALLTIHVTTPFLNHPLGIGLIIVCIVTFYALDKHSLQSDHRHL